MINRFIVVQNGREEAKVRVTDIIMIERIGRKLRIMTDERNFDYYERLENVIRLLDGRFFPCLKGCYVNFERVERMAEQSIFFDNGLVYGLGRENFLRTRHEFKEYLQKMAEKMMKKACNSNENSI